MAVYADLIYHTRKYFPFSTAEWSGFLIAVVAIGFIVSFNQWGYGAAVDIAFGFKNLLIGIIIAAITVFIHHAGQRIAALAVGYRAEQRLWSWGIFAGILAAFISASLTRGRFIFWLLVPTTSLFHMLPGYRLGFLKYGPNVFGIGMVSIFGPMANIAFAVLLRIIMDFFSSEWLTTLFLLNVAYGFYMLLPIPPCDGSRLLYGSRMVYVFMASSLLAAIILALADIPLWIIVVGSSLIGFICWITYYLALEKHWWKGPYP